MVLFAVVEQEIEEPFQEDEELVQLGEEARPFQALVLAVLLPLDEDLLVMELRIHLRILVVVEVLRVLLGQEGAFAEAFLEHSAVVLLGGPFAVELLLEEEEVRLAVGHQVDVDLEKINTKREVVS